MSLDSHLSKHLNETVVGGRWVTHWGKPKLLSGSCLHFQFRFLLARLTQLNEATLFADSFVTCPSSPLPHLCTSLSSPSVPFPHLSSTSIYTCYLSSRLRALMTISVARRIHIILTPPPPSISITIVTFQS